MPWRALLSDFLRPHRFLFPSLWYSPFGSSSSSASRPSFLFRLCVICLNTDAFFPFSFFPFLSYLDHRLGWGLLKSLFVLLFDRFWTNLESSRPWHCCKLAPAVVTSIYHFDRTDPKGMYQQQSFIGAEASRISGTSVPASLPAPVFCLVCMCFFVLLYFPLFTLRAIT